MRIVLREELFHPLISHFPIAFLITASCLKLFLFITLILKKEGKFTKIQTIAQALLFAGTALLLPTIFLGDMAFETIKQNLCEITIAYQHEQLSETTLMIFILGLILQFLEYLPAWKGRFRISKELFLVIILSLGSYYLIRTSHLGATMVYEHGAAVTNANCNS